VLTFLAPGIWQQRHRAHETAAGVPAAPGGRGGEAEAGLYEMRFTPPRPGLYYVFVQSRSQGLGFNGSPYVTLMAETARDAADRPGERKQE
jgi:hypothetical protein